MDYDDDQVFFCACDECDCTEQVDEDGDICDLCYFGTHLGEEL